jgi:hypothetical protein
MTQTQQSPSTARYLEAFGRLAALTTVLLPAAGFAVRYIAFWSAGVKGEQSSLALGVPVSQLVVTGAEALLPAAMIFAFLWWVWLRPGSSLRQDARRRAARRRDTLRRRHVHPAEASSPWQSVRYFAATRRGFLAFNVAVAALVICAILFMPGFPGPPLTVIAAFLFTPFASRAVNRPPEQWFSHAWPALVVVVLLFASISGLRGVLPGIAVAHYDLAPTTSIGAGRYQQLGSDGSRRYLEPCTPGRRATFGVRDVDISLVTGEGSSAPSFWQLVPTGPSLWAIIFDGASASFGLQRC